MENNTSQKPMEKDTAATLTDLQKKAVAFAGRYKKLSLQEKVNVIARTFGCETGEIYTTPCRGEWRGTSDMYIRFDHGGELFLCNSLTSKAKTVKVRTEYVDSALVHYNPEIVQATKEEALSKLRKWEAVDNAIAVNKGLDPYTLLCVEFNNDPDAGYMGWYYVTLAVGGKIHAHLETNLHYAILNGKVGATPRHECYFPAGALKESDVDYVFHNVGFSAKSHLYTLPLREDVRERAKKTLDERTASIQQEEGSSVYELCEGDGFARMVATYSLDSKAALVAYIRQSIYKDFATWAYPDEIPGMRESDTVKDHWYYDDHAGRRVLCAYPKSTCF